MLNRNLVWKLIILSVAVTALGAYQLTLLNDDPTLYANIARHIVTSNDWVRLFSYYDQPWLDKPHFPFWMTAISFKIFGVSAWSYNLPGIIFNFIGAIYTYKLGKYIYNRDVGLLACLFYLTSAHLFTSSTIDVRAEAYLMGQIIPACYYWLRYDRNTRLRYLLLGAMFTGFAMMTKGIFVVVTIFGGMVACWLYTRQFSRIINPKWLLAYLLSLVFIVPEIISLYLQFDLHPELTVFGKQHVSGVWWYFWGSQFGRFFNTGPIVNTHGNPLFFTHTYLWAALPWSLLFVIAVISSLIKFRNKENKTENVRSIYLLSSFFLTFIMFSMTKFQLDHYTNIIIPFAVVLTANYLLNTSNTKWISLLQKLVGLFLLVLCTALSVFVFQNSYVVIYAIIPLVTLLYCARRSAFYGFDAIYAIPALATNVAFGFILLINHEMAPKYDVGYQIAQVTNKQPNIPIFDVSSNVPTLGVYTNSIYRKVHVFNDVVEKGSFYLITNKNQFSADQVVPQHLNYINSYCGNNLDKLLPYYSNKEVLGSKMACFDLYIKK